jgi:histidinol-phosphate aminotransferase
MKFINRYLRNLKPYNVASHKIWDDGGVNAIKILKLDWNESTIPPSPLVKKSLLKIVENENLYSLYPSTNNIKLLDKISSYVGLPIGNVQYFASSDSLHEYLVKMYIGVGDPILILGPTYDNFRLTAESQGGNVTFFNYSTNCELDFDLFIESIKSLSPSLVYICNPNNPTGNLIDINSVKFLLNLFPETVFLVDEAYYEFSGVSMSKYVLEFDNLFISRTFSKAFGLANFRIGYLISSCENILQISKIRNPKNVTTFAQEAAISALSDVEYMNSYVEQVNSAKLFFSVELKSKHFIKEVHPSESNFLLVEFFDFETKTNFFEFLSANNIFLRNLSHSSILNNCLRITIGNVEQMKNVVSVINNFIG